MKTVLSILFVFLLAQNNYIEVDGKRTYLNSMTEQEIAEDKKQKKEPHVAVPAPKVVKETTVIVVPQKSQPNIVIEQPQYINPYDGRIRVKITNKRTTDKELFESTGKGTLKKTEVYKGKKVEEEWKTEGGNLVKERKLVK